MIFPIYAFTDHDKITYENTHQLFCYNISKDSWEWPNVHGDIPSPRSGHKTIISDGTVFLYGGSITNDLYILDMTKMTWRQVYGTIKNDNPGRIVTGRKGPHTLVTISKSAAVLFGAFYSNGISHDDCWLLDLHKAREQKEPSIIWTKVGL